MPPKHFGSLNLKTGVYVIGSDMQEVAKETGSTAYPINQSSYDRKDEFLNLFTDIVDLDAPSILGNQNGKKG